MQMNPSSANVKAAGHKLFSLAKFKQIQPLTKTHRPVKIEYLAHLSRLSIRKTHCRATNHLPSLTQINQEQEARIFQDGGKSQPI